VDKAGRLPVIRSPRQPGFTIIELMVTISVFAILFAVAFPPMTTWINNNKVRAVADALQNGIRLAQAESLRRSRQVVFSLTNSATPSGGFTAAANGNYWSVNVIPSMLDGTDGTTQAAFVESGVINTNTRVVIGGPAEICFNSVGRLTTNGTTGIPGATCAAPAAGAATWYDITLQGGGADARQLRVTVNVGGQVHMCDRGRVYSDTNPDGC
jgi:type IV fimbrial biogenesis protein FimT